MSISTLYASTEPVAGASSAIVVVPSGQAPPANATSEQLSMLNERLRSELTLYKGIAVGGMVLAAGVAVAAVVQRALMGQKLALARAEGAAVGYQPQTRQQTPSYYPPQGYPPSYYR